MSARADGGPAFPVSKEIELTQIDDGWGSTGMTLRDYFAAKAMASLFLEFSQAVTAGNASHHGKWASSISQVAYEMADAMLAARGGR